MAVSWSPRGSGQPGICGLISCNILTSLPASTLARLHPFPTQPELSLPSVNWIMYFHLEALQVS